MFIVNVLIQKLSSTWQEKWLEYCEAQEVEVQPGVNEWGFEDLAAQGLQAGGASSGHVGGEPPARGQRSSTGQAPESQGLMWQVWHYGAQGRRMPHGGDIGSNRGC